MRDAISIRESVLKAESRIKKEPSPLKKISKIGIKRAKKNRLNQHPKLMEEYLCLVSISGNS